MLVVQTTLHLDPDHRQTALDHITTLRDHAQTQEDGTIRYRATQALDDPNTIHFFEQYEDADAADAHTDSEPYRRFTEALPTITDGDIETLQFEIETAHAAKFNAEEAVAALD